MKYHLLSLALLILALVLETAGIGGGGALVLGAGIACEIWFWIRAVSGRPPRRQSGCR
jgi:hypothetical protein